MKEIEIYSGDFTSVLNLPYSDAGVRAGFPSPAQDYLDRTLDLNKDLIRHPAATFYARVVGTSMIDAGINEGDILIIDRSLTPTHGDVVVAYVNGEFTIKRLDTSHEDEGVIWLRPENKLFPAFSVSSDDEFTIWGVVASVIKNLRPQ